MGWTDNILYLIAAVLYSFTGVIYLVSQNCEHWLFWGLTLLLIGIYNWTYYILFWMRRNKVCVAEVPLMNLMNPIIIIKT